MDRCAYCGEELNPNAHFCPNCGRPRAEAPQPEAAPEAPLAEAEYEIEEAEYTGKIHIWRNLCNMPRTVQVGNKCKNQKTDKF